ncbi:hypothetical protein [Parasphingorhabdus sp.]|uniref:hypothetical protein n=1 Tax=Parasphingorhabdus sp. TaxID=2709688 RepID=UPI003593B78E
MIGLNRMPEDLAFEQVIGEERVYPTDPRVGQMEQLEAAEYGTAAQCLTNQMDCSAVDRIAAKSSRFAMQIHEMSGAAALSLSRGCLSPTLTQCSAQR